MNGTGSAGTGGSHFVSISLTSTGGPSENAASLNTSHSYGIVNGPSEAAKGSKLAIEIAVLTVLLMVVWGLLSLPVIFFHLPVELDVQTDMAADINTSNVTSCLSAMPYPADGVCHTALTGTLLSANCETPLVLRDAESSASQLLPLLDFLDPSPACSEAVVPFLCVFLFGLCDSSGVPIQPTSTQCEHIRDVLCREEWRRASELLENLPDFMNLPDCGGFPAEQASCPASSGSGMSGSGMSGSGMSGSGMSGSDLDAAIDVTTVSQNTSISEPLQCREDFFREEEEGGACIPSCYTWKEYSLGEVIATDVVIGLSALIGFFSGLTVIIISCIRFKRMFTFPSIIVVYMTIDLMVIEFFIIISYFDRPSLYCTSMNLIDSLLESTAFCVITGITFFYLLLQVAIWWFFHTTTLFWKINFPIHARSFEATHKTKYLHIVAIVVSLVLPLVSVIAPMADFAVDLKSDDIRQSRNITFLSGGLGFRLIRFPPILCSGGDSNAVYYSSVLPINILMLFGITELIFIFYSIHKHHGLFDSRESKSIFKIGTAERKILITLCYYVVVTVFALTSFTLATRNSDPFATQLLNYFICEQPGHNPAAPCDRSTFRQLAYPGVTAVAFVLLSLFPAVNLVYALNVTEMKMQCEIWCGGRKRKYRSESTTNTNTTSQM